MKGEEHKWRPGGARRGFSIEFYAMSDNRYYVELI